MSLFAIYSDNGKGIRKAKDVSFDQSVRRYDRDPEFAGQAARRCRIDHSDGREKREERKKVRSHFGQSERRGENEKLPRLLEALTCRLDSAFVAFEDGTGPKNTIRVVSKRMRSVRG